LVSFALQNVRDFPDLVAAAKRLRRSRPKGGQRSLREVSAELAKLGYLNERGRPFAAASVKVMIDGPQ
jgi:hypothetical protein